MIATHSTRASEVIKKDGYIRPKSELNHEVDGLGACLRSDEEDKNFVFFSLSNNPSNNEDYEKYGYGFDFDLDMLINDYAASIRFENPKQMIQINEKNSSNFDDKVAGEEAYQLLSIIKDDAYMIYDIEVVVEGAVDISVAIN